MLSHSKLQSANLLSEILLSYDDINKKQIINKIIFHDDAATENGSLNTMCGYKLLLSSMDSNQIIDILVVDSVGKFNTRSLIVKVYLVVYYKGKNRFNNNYICTACLTIMEKLRNFLEMSILVPYKSNLKYEISSSGFNIILFEYKDTLSFYKLGIYDKEYALFYLDSNHNSIGFLGLNNNNECFS